MLSFLKERPTYISQLAAMFSAVIFLFLNEMSFYYSNQATENLINIVARQTQLQQLMATISEAETNQRGYLLTSNDAYLKLYEKAMQTIPKILDETRETYIKDGVDLGNFSEMSRAVIRRTTEMQTLQQLNKKNLDATTWAEVLQGDHGTQYMDSIRYFYQLLYNECIKQSDLAKQKIRSSLIVARLGIMCATMLALFIFILYLRQSNKLLQADQNLQKTLLQERTELEAIVKERTLRLSELASHLQNMQENERRLLAQELHDELGAILIAAKLDIARLRQQVSVSAKQKTMELAAHLNQTINLAVSLKQKIIDNLHPTALTNFGLLHAINQLCLSYKNRAGFKIQLAIEEVNLNQATQLALYRIIQEALTNITKYANATIVSIAIKKNGNTIKLKIADNGHGFNPNNVGLNAHGISGMRHRTEALRGLFTIDSNDHGTLIIVEIPI